MARSVRAFVAMIAIGWIGAWLTGVPAAPAPAPAAPPPAHRPVAVTVPANTTTVAPATTTTAALVLAAPSRPQRASRAATRPRPALDDATRRRVIDAIYAYSDWDPARMVRVASCESGLNPWAVNGSYHGILQIRNATLGLIEEHIALGHQIWLRHGYGAWQCKG